MYDDIPLVRIIIRSNHRMLLDRITDRGPRHIRPRVIDATCIHSLMAAAGALLTLSPAASGKGAAAAAGPQDGRVEQGLEDAARERKVHATVVIGLGVVQAVRLGRKDHASVLKRPHEARRRRQKPVRPLVRPLVRVR